MRTTIILNDKLYQEASKAVGVTEKTKLIHLGLEALVSQVAVQRLANLYGRMPKARPISRRRLPKAAHK